MTDELLLELALVPESNLLVLTSSDSDTIGQGQD